MRIGSLSYATDQGLSHLLKWFYDAGVVTDVLLVKHPRHLHRPEWYPSDTTVVDPRTVSIDQFRNKIDLLLCWETPFNWELFRQCYLAGVKSVLCTMIEWTPRIFPVKPDAVVCPSLLDYDEFKGEFPADRCKFIPVPAPPLEWAQRTRAMRFLHNAGHVGHREHKGTRQLLEALRFVKSPIDLTVRCQYEGMIEQMALGQDLEGWTITLHREHDSQCFQKADTGKQLTLESRSIPYDQLFDGFDAYVAPEKLNGLSLPLQEAFASGLLVVTTDRYPTNTWLLPAGDDLVANIEYFQDPANSPMITPKRFEPACISRNYREFQEAVVEPEAIAAKLDTWHGKDITLWSEAGRRWAEANSWQRLKPQYLEFFEAVCTHS